MVDPGSDPQDAQDEPLVQRDETADDHDLLTYGEVGARISENLAEEQQRLTTLREQLATSDADATTSLAADVQRAEARIAALRAVRDRVQPDKDALHAFLDYDPRAPR
jgi:hypothetical protein